MVIVELRMIYPPLDLLLMCSLFERVSSNPFRVSTRLAQLIYPRKHANMGSTTYRHQWGSRLLLELSWNLQQIRYSNKLYQPPPFQLPLQPLILYIMDGVIYQTFTHLFRALLSITELLQALPHLLSTPTQSSQPWPSYVISKCLILLISPSISIPHLTPYELMLLLLMFQDIATAQGSPTTKLRSRIASSSTLIGSDRKSVV